jgi:hypothetical protein
MQRRLFSSLVLAWAGTAWPPARPAVAAGDPDALATMLAQVTPDRAAAARMGRAYLAVADRRRLAATEACLRGSCGATLAELRRTVADLTRKDLARSDTVLVEGWVLARAEAETLALIALHGAPTC